MDKKDPGEGPMAVAREILSYLIEHPDAKDTVDGILRWWLTKGCIEWKEEEVKEAIDFLVSKGWMVEREITPKVYEVDRERMEEMKAFLNLYEDKQKENRLEISDPS